MPLRLPIIPTFLLCLSVLCLSAAGQQSAADASKSEDEPFKLGANTTRVLVQVVVRDRQGHIIDSLKREDFKILDNDKVQALSGFMVERHTAAVSAAEVGKAPANSQASAPASTGPRRFIVFLFDDLHLSLQDMAHAQQAGARVLAETLAGSDMAAVVSVSGKTNSGLTNDRAKLQEAIQSLRTRSVYKADGAECPNVDYYQADQIENKHNNVALDAAIQQVYSCSPGLNPQRDHDVAERMAESASMRSLNLGQLDVQTTFAAIGDLVHRMSALPGQSTLVLVSPGFLSVSAEARTAESHIIDLAAQANITISALDARGLYTTELDASERSQGSARTMQLKAEYRRTSGTQSENPMAELADGTGGTFFHNSNDLNAGFKGLIEVPECIYVLEFAPENLKQNGTYHRLKVKVDQDGLQLQARHGYFVPKPVKTKK